MLVRLEAPDNVIRSAALNNEAAVSLMVSVMLPVVAAIGLFASVA